MRAARLAAGLLAAFFLGLVLVEPRLEPIRAESEESPLEEPFPVEPEQVGSPATTELHAGLWRVDGGFVSTIRIKNSLVVAPLEVTPILYMADGTAYTLAPVLLPVSGVATVNVNEALAAAPEEIAEHISPFDSAALRYTYPTRHHVLGSIEVLDLSGSLIFTYPFSGGAEEEPGAQTLEGVWWRHEPEVGGFVALANTTAATVTATVQVIGSGGTALAPQVVEVAAHGTAMLELDSLAGGLPGLENQAGGIRVQYEGRPGDFLIAGGLVDESAGYSANMIFWERDAEPAEPQKITYASVGMIVGEPNASSGFPGGTRFAPYAALRNTTAAPLTISPSVNFMSGARPVTRTLPTIQLGPNETRHLTFERFFESLGLRGLSGTINVTVSFEGRAGDLVLATGSVDESGTYVFEVEPQGVGRSLSKEGHYWKVADGFDTTFALWNPTEEAQDYLVTFFFGEEGGQYKLPVRLAAKASRTIEVSQVIAAQVPDADGKVILLDTREGSVAFSNAKGMTEWMTLVISGGVLNIQAATCGEVTCINCCGYTLPRVIPNLTLVVGKSGQMNAVATYCNGRVDTFTSSSTWSSNNTAVATVSGGLVTAGTTTGTAEIKATFPWIPLWTGQMCNLNPSCPTGRPAPKANATVYDFTVNISPSTIRPRGTGGTNETTTVTVQTNPSVCQSVTFQDQRIHGSGGHPTNHPTTLPSGTGGTFSSPSSCSDGKITSTYTARDFGGEHFIKATMQGVTKTAPITLRAKVENLEQLTASSSDNFYNSNSSAGQIAHPDNWWGTSTTLNGLVATALACGANSSCAGSKLPYNDISLPWGGKFDGNSFNWTGGHDTHREGRNCDVNVCDWSQVRKDTLWGLFGNPSVGAATARLDECPDPSKHTWHITW